MGAIRSAGGTVSDKPGFFDQARLALGIGAALAAPGVPAALVSRADLPLETRTAMTRTVDDLHEAVVEGVEGAREGEDAASAEPYAEPESGVYADPPEGNTFGFTVESVDVSGILAEHRAAAEFDGVADTGAAANTGDAAEASEPADAAENSEGESRAQ